MGVAKGRRGRWIFFKLLICPVTVDQKTTHAALTWAAAGQQAAIQQVHLAMKAARTPPQQVGPPPLRRCQRAAPPANRLSLHTRRPLVGAGCRLQGKQYLNKTSTTIEHEEREEWMTVPGTSPASRAAAAASFPGRAPAAGRLPPHLQHLGLCSRGFLLRRLSPLLLLLQGNPPASIAAGWRQPETAHCALTPCLHVQLVFTLTCFFFCRLLTTEEKMPPAGRGTEHVGIDAL